MTVIEKINEINEVLKEVFDFTQANSEVKADFDEYLATMGAGNISLNQMEKIFLPYIFERRLNNKPVMEMFAETSKNKKIAETKRMRRTWLACVFSEIQESSFSQFRSSASGCEKPLLR